MTNQGHSTSDEHAHHRATPPPRSFKVPFIIAAVVVGAVILAAIVWGMLSSERSTSAPTGTATTAPPTPTATATAPPTQAPVTPPPLIEGACAFDDLRADLGTPDGAAGNTEVAITFTNTGTDECTLAGYPTVAFVGDGDGTQLGAAATEDAGVAVSTVSLPAGGSVSALLTVTETGNVDSCNDVTADGLRVFPPSSNDAFFIATTQFQACDNPNVTVLKVGPVAQ